MTYEVVNVVDVSWTVFVFQIVVVLVAARLQMPARSRRRSSFCASLTSARVVGRAGASAGLVGGSDIVLVAIGMAVKPRFSFDVTVTHIVSVAVPSRVVDTSVSVRVVVLDRVVVASSVLVFQFVFVIVFVFVTLLVTLVIQANQQTRFICILGGAGETYVDAPARFSKWRLSRSEESLTHRGRMACSAIASETAADPSRDIRSWEMSLESTADDCPSIALLVVAGKAANMPRSICTCNRRSILHDVEGGFVFVWSSDECSGQ